MSRLAACVFATGGNEGAWIREITYLPAKAEPRYHLEALRAVPLPSPEVAGGPSQMQQLKTLAPVRMRMPGQYR